MLLLTSHANLPHTALPSSHPFLSRYPSEPGRFRRTQETCATIAKRESVFATSKFIFIWVQPVFSSQELRRRKGRGTADRHIIFCAPQRWFSTEACRQPCPDDSSTNDTEEGRGLYFQGRLFVCRDMGAVELAQQGGGREGGGAHQVECIDTGRIGRPAGFWSLGRIGRCQQHGLSLRDGVI